MGKGGERAPAAVGKQKKDVLIEGELYDVTAFKHPGGSILKFLTNEGDATESFVEFHGRSRTARAVLKSLPHAPAPAAVVAARGGNGKPSLSADYAKLRAVFKAEGRFDASPSEVVYRLGELAVMHAVGAYFVMFTARFYAGLGILGLASGRCGWVMHEAGHYSLTARISTDRRIQEFVYGCGCGMSAAWWRSQHNKHHATPQKLQHDVDLDTLPLVAFHSTIASQARSPVLKAWLRAQAVLFVPLSCLLVAFGWQVFLHPRHALRTKRGFEGFSMAARYAVLFLCVFKNLSWPSAIGAYVLYDQIASSYIFTNFSLSHTHLPVSGADDYLHWVEYAAKHTTNIAAGPICNWWMANLNFQIEHHLFPAMPQFQHKTISPRVKQLFEKHGLVYDVRPYFTCLKQTLENLHAVGASAAGDAAKADRFGPSGSPGPHSVTVPPGEGTPARRRR